MSYDLTNFQVGDEFEGSPSELSVIISAILAEGGSFRSAGKSITIDSLPNREIKKVKELKAEIETIEELKVEIKKVEEPVAEIKTEVVEMLKSEPVEEVKIEPKKFVSKPTGRPRRQAITPKPADS